MNFNRLDYHLVSLDSVNSTNEFALNLLKTASPLNGTVIFAREQFGGKGQRGSTWESDPGQNLTFSLIVYPDLFPEDVFTLSAMSALAVYHAIQKSGSECKVKWPNDLLIGQKKCGGILIENGIRQGKVAHSVIGIGLNINQTDFGNHFQATSLKESTGKAFEVRQILDMILAEFALYWDKLMLRKYAAIRNEYHEVLFGLDQSLNFSDNEGNFEGIIRGVDEKGYLKIERKGSIKKYDLKEVRFEL